MSCYKNGMDEICDILLETFEFHQHSLARICLFNAVRKGYLNVVQWLFKYGIKNCTKLEALNASSSHPKVSSFIIEHDKIEFTSFDITNDSDIIDLEKLDLVILRNLEKNKHLKDDGEQCGNRHDFYIYGKGLTCNVIENDVKTFGFKNAACRYGAKSGFIDVLVCAVNHGADVSADDNYALRMSAQIWAEYTSLILIKFLVEHGADVTAYDNFAVKESYERCHHEVVKFLVEHGAEEPVSWTSFFREVDEFCSSYM